MIYARFRDEGDIELTMQYRVASVLKLIIYIIYNLQLIAIQAICKYMLLERSEKMERSDEYVGYKIRLNPTAEQIQIFNKYFGMRRFVYNLGINLQEANYLDESTDHHLLSAFTLNKMIVQMRKTDTLKWLNDFDLASIRLALTDSVNAYMMFFNKHSANRRPVYKSKKKSKKTFSVRASRIAISEKFIRLPSIGFVKVYDKIPIEIIGNGNKNLNNANYLRYLNTRISFDGLYYYLSFSLPKDDTHNIHSYSKYGGNEEYVERESSESIGIDLGCKGYNWIVDSAGNRVELPDFSKEERKLKGLHKKFARQLRTNAKKKRKPSFKQNKPVLYERTKNEQKTIAKINKYYKRIKNRRKNKVYEYCKTLLELKPRSVVLESLKESDMLINDNKRCNIQKQMFNHKIRISALYETSNIISRTLDSNNIPIIFADREYPSSQICSCCGYQQKIGRKRYFRCSQCGSVIDRDYNASLNLASLGL